MPSLLNIPFANLTQSELLSQLTNGVLITPNVDQMVKLQKDKDFYEIVRKAEWVVCDSKILYLCSKLTKHPLKTYIPGSSFFPMFCDYHKDDEDCKIFLLGAMDGVALKAQERINKRIGRNIIGDF